MARNRLNQKATLSPLLSQGSQPRELLSCARRAAETGVNFERPLCVTTHGCNPQRLGSPGQPWGCQLCASSSAIGHGEGGAVHSSRWLIELIEEAEKLWPHSSSVIAFTFRVDTPCTYISASAATSARSDR